MGVAKLLQTLLKICFRSADIVRGLYVYLMVNLCGGSCRGLPRVGKGVVFKYPPHAGVTIGKGCDIGAFSSFDVPPGGVLRLGDNVKLTAGVTITAAGKIDIGSDCLIAEWSSIRDSQHQYADGALIRSQPLDVGFITIGKDVWIGRGVTVLMNSVLEDGCVVGAQSIVKRQTLERNTVYVGAPLRKIGLR